MSDSVGWGYPVAGAVSLVAPGVELNNATPSVRRHYSAFYPTAGRFAPVPRVGSRAFTGASRLSVSLRVGATGSHPFHARACLRVTPPSCRMPPGQKSGRLPDSSRGNDIPPVLTSSLRFRHVISGPLALVSLSPT